MHNEQINKYRTKYEILVSLAKEKAQSSSHMVKFHKLVLVGPIM
jgi:hypothetical protein